MISYFSAHCISDHHISNPNHNPSTNPDPIPDHDCSHLLVRNAVGRKGGHQYRHFTLVLFQLLSIYKFLVAVSKV